MPEIPDVDTVNSMARENLWESIDGGGEDINVEDYCLGLVPYEHNNYADRRILLAFAPSVFF